MFRFSCFPISFCPPKHGAQESLMVAYGWISVRVLMAICSYSRICLFYLVCFFEMYLFTTRNVFWEYIFLLRLPCWKIDHVFDSGPKVESCKDEVGELQVPRLYPSVVRVFKSLNWGIARKTRFHDAVKMYGFDRSNFHLILFVKHWRRSKNIFCSHMKYSLLGNWNMYWKAISLELCT